MKTKIVNAFWKFVYAVTAYTAAVWIVDFLKEWRLEFGQSRPQQ